MIYDNRALLNDLKIIDNEVKISIVIPTYNERDNLKILLDSLIINLKNIDKYEIIIVDDNSPDGTGKIAQELCNSISELKVIHRPKKLGLASALIDGFKVSRGEFIAVTDADMQHSPAVFKKFLNEAKKGSELIIASRYKSGGNVNRWKLSRRIVSRIATAMAHLLLPKSRKVDDPLSGNFMFKKNKLIKTHLTGIGWKLLLELLVIGKFEKIVEIPYTFNLRTKGESKLSFNEYIDFLRLLYLLKTHKNIK